RSARRGGRRGPRSRDGATGGRVAVRRGRASGGRSAGPRGACGIDLLVGRLRADALRPGRMTEILQIAALVVFIYFAVYNLLTLALLAMSFGEMSWLLRGRQPGRSGLRPL